MSDTLHVDGARLEIAEWGGNADARTPIVLLHEGLGSVSTWRNFPGDLAARTGRHVLAFSRFGHGRSEPPRRPHTTYFMHDEARLLPAILDAAHIERAILLGHSDGGSIALIFAAEHGDRVSALILEAPHVFVEDISIASIEQTSTEYHQTDLRERLARHHSDVDLAFHGWSDVWLNPEFRGWNLESHLPQITCPTLLIQGEEDTYGTLRQIDAIATQIRGRVERLILRDCGHSPHRDQPAAVLSAMTSFVQTLD